MVIDTSAIITFLRDETGADAIGSILEDADGLRMSAVNAFECRIVLLRRFGMAAVGELDVLLMRAEVLVAPFDAEQAELALDAYHRFGKGSGHPAQLNLGDCAAYALARSLDAPLLFTGEDFARTDVPAAIPPAEA